MLWHFFTICNGKKKKQIKIKTVLKQRLACGFYVCIFINIYGYFCALVCQNVSAQSKLKIHYNEIFY